jgi:indole-3-glycerol phosphate synthase
MTRISAELHDSRTGTEVQERMRWTPPSGPLGRLSDRARERSGALRSRATELRRRAEDRAPVPSFADALRQGPVAVVAELKRRSPSKGDINVRLDSAEQARAYATGGAAALSILTEPTEFGGASDDLLEARRACELPLLKKDFHVDVVQVLEAAALGASAMLLIARALEPSQLEELAGEAAHWRVELLVEVRDEEELARALSVPGAMVGVNTRNLETLAIDAATGDRLIPGIPVERVAVWESGVSSRVDVERAARAGADAVLVGSSLSASGDPVAALAALTGVPRMARAR